MHILKQIDQFLEKIEGNLIVLILNFIILLSLIIVIVPLVIPIAQSFDVNMIHLGIIFLTNLKIGYSTPPVGINLFIAATRFNKPIFKVLPSRYAFFRITVSRAHLDNLCTCN
jgi:C4-dicarboxylate transporter, DctM subunit